MFNLDRKPWVYDGEIDNDGITTYEKALQEEIFEDFPVGQRLSCTHSANSDITGNGIIIFNDEIDHTVTVKIYWNRIPRRKTSE